VNITYDHDFFSSFKYSGVSRYFFELISRLSRTERARVSLYMGWHINEFGFEKLRPDLKMFFGLHKPSLPHAGRLFSAASDVFLQPFLKLSNPDIYHQTYYRYFVPSYKGKRIITVYDMTYELFPDLFDRNARVIQEKRMSVERADGIIAISQSAKDDLVRIWNIDPNRIKVIHLANSLQFVDPPAPAIDSPYLLYVGQRIAHKNASTLLHAYGKTPEIHTSVKLVFFGGAPFSPDELQLIDQYGIAGRVLQCSGDDKLLSGYYRHARALVYPSRYEGFGLPLLEAMHYGCPVIASCASSLPEIAGTAAVYFNPDDTEELSSGILKVLTDSEFRSTLQNDGRMREKEFSWDRCARETLDFYKTVA
jgi:glycosyltransferase involved in cell wall biosynthesis